MKLKMAQADMSFAQSACNHIIPL